MESPAVIKKKRGISPVWTLPILALVLCGWLLYRSFAEAGIEITVYFEDASGIVPEKTQVMTRGIPFGLVKGVAADFEKQMVRVTIRVDRSTEPYLVEDLKFWLVKPEVSASRITGLETILTGSYIGVQRGESTTPARTFTALTTAPPIPSDTPGLHIELHAADLRSIQENSPIYFRNIRIGSVKTYELDEDDSVRIYAFVEPDFSHLIRTGTRFYDASGISISGSIPDIDIRMESLSALFIGGIVAATPEPLQDSPPAESGRTYTLYEDYKAAEFGIPMTLKLASGSGIGEGSTKVMYRGLEAGTVSDISINDDPVRSVTARILLDPRAEIILRENTRFWLVTPEVSLDGIHNLNTLISGPYITFQPGDGAFKDTFEVLPEAPIMPPLRPGSTFVLGSAMSPTSGAGAPVYYKKMKIGQLLGSELGADRKTVETMIYIFDPYRDLITTDAVFVESGGISIDADLSGFSFKMAPLLSTFKGGIDLIFPPKQAAQDRTPADENARFTLYPDYQSAAAATPALLPDGLYLKLVTDNLDSYRAGSPILFKKIRVGRVIGYEYAREDQDVVLDCFIEKQYADLVTSRSKFYRASGIRVEGSLSGLSLETESVESLIAGGIGFITLPGGGEVEPDQRFTVYESRAQARAADDAVITVRFDNVARLAVGAPVQYRGIRIGSVAATSLDEDLKTIVAVLSIDKQYETFFRKDTQIWLARPVVRINRIERLDRLLFGTAIEIEPGSGKLNREFTGRASPPHPFFTSFDGLGLVLEAKQLGSLTVGSPVYYRRVKVGEVAGYDLAYDFKEVLVYVIIEQRYAPLIRKNTRFWNASGVTVTGGVFSGLTVSTESLEALLAGGIALATPGREEMGPRVETGFRFRLFEAPEEGWLDWSPDIFVVEEEQRQPLPQ